MDKFASQFFSGKSIGRSLKEVAVDAVKAEAQDVVTRWYHGVRAGVRADLFTWTDLRNNIIKQQLHFYGQVVEWNCLEGLKTGLVIESDLGLKATYNAEGKMETPRVAESVQFDQNPMAQSVDLALEILTYTSFEDQIREQLVNNLRDPQNLTTMLPEDFVLRFGHALKDLKEGSSRHSYTEAIIKSFKKLIK